MIRVLARKISLTVLLSTAMAVGQQIPITAPALLPFPELRTGLSYYSLKPTENLPVSGGGWTLADTLRGVMTSIELELVRYHWWDHLFPQSNYDLYSSLTYGFRTQLGSESLPAGYPIDLEVNGSELSGFALNIQTQQITLENTFVYPLGRRTQAQASLGLGIAHVTMYKNGDNVRILSSNGYHFGLGVGAKTTLFGRMGKRLRLGVELGFTAQGFDLTDQGETLSLPDDAGGPVSPIQSLSLLTPDLQVQLEFGEFLFGAYTPFRDPYRLGLFNLSAGLGVLTHETGVSIQYDSAGTTLNIPFTSSISQNYDLQLFKYNWPFHFIRQANIDAFSGVGVRFWKMARPNSLPDGWADQLTDGNQTYSQLKFSPRVFNLYLEHEIIYPFGPKLFSRVRGGAGYATMTLYENEVLDRVIDAAGLTWHMGTGLGFNIKGDGSSRVSLGVNLDYVHQAFEIDRTASNLSAVNADELIPIKYIDLSQPIFSVNIGLIFGGYPNDAQKAFEAFQDKHYTRSLELMQELLQFNPNHHNRDGVLIQKQMVEDSLVAKYYRDVRTILSQGKIENAYALIQQGETPPGAKIAEAVHTMRVEITNRGLERAAEALKMLDYEQAEDLILLALKSDPSSYSVAKVLLARSYIIRATVLYQSGVYGRSLFWLKQADGLTDRYRMVTAELRQKIGDGRLDDANQGILKEDREMVFEAMKDAKALNPILSDLVNEHLDDLEEAISYADDQRIAPMKRMALDNLLDDVGNLNPDNFEPKVGMQGSLIIRYIGPPERKFREGDYELFVYPKSEATEVWLYLRNNKIEKVETHKK